MPSVYVHCHLQKEFTVYVDKNGTVEDLLCEAAKEVKWVVLVH